MKTQIRVFDHISLVLLEMRNVSEKFEEKIKTHFIFNNAFRKSCRL
jgi:hypothetical protein